MHSVNLYNTFVLSFASVVEITSNESASMIGVIRRATTFTPLAELKVRTDFSHRLPLDVWWLKLRPLLRIMAKHETSYERESVNLSGTLLTLTRPSTRGASLTCTVDTDTGSV